NVTNFEVMAKQEIRLTLKNAGELPKESMGHNIVVLAPGTSIPDFATEAFRWKDADYIPEPYESSIMTHSRLLGPGESDTITFDLENPGVYEFICSFPGHWGTMHGSITVSN
ncbi:MAG: plastocyanin/azurin family copper-binding protein, partial [Xanthomarina sp.]